MFFSRFVLALGVAASLGLAGCAPSEPAGKPFTDKDDVNNTTPEAPHPEHGPNGGHIVELGKEEFHAEVAIDKDRKLIVWLLDESMKAAKPVENGTVQIMTKVDAKDVTLDLVAAPLEGEKDGKCSRFELAADKLPGAVMDIEGLTGELMLKVGDTKLQNSLTGGHDHGHEGHAH